MALLGKGRKKDQAEETDDIEQAEEELEEEAKPARKKGGFLSRFSRKKEEAPEETADEDEDEDEDDGEIPGLPMGAAIAASAPQPAPLDLAPTPPAAPESPKPEGEADSLFKLKDIFEEAAQVDENLQRLAMSVEDVTAEDLADDLRSFLDELEQIMEPALTEER